MNKFIKEQLKNCRVNLPYWDDKTTELFIPKNQQHMTTPDARCEIKIKPYVINEPDNFTLSIDWNNGTTPPEEYMVVKLIDNKGKMTRVQGIGKNTGIMWEGWLPEKCFRLM